MATLQAGNQHDTFELERAFAELCKLLEAVELRLEGLFLNVDKAFDVSSLWLVCAWCGIGVNISRNRRTKFGKPTTSCRSTLNSTATGWSLSALMFCSIALSFLLVSYYTCLQSLLNLYYMVIIALLHRKTVLTSKP